MNNDIASQQARKSSNGGQSYRDEIGQQQIEKLPPPVELSQAAFFFATPRAASNGSLSSPFALNIVQINV